MANSLRVHPITVGKEEDHRGNWPVCLQVGSRERGMLVLALPPPFPLIKKKLIADCVCLYVHGGLSLYVCVCICMCVCICIVSLSVCVCHGTQVSGVCPRFQSVVPRD